MKNKRVKVFVVTIHRVLLSLIFLVAGFGHLLNTEKIVVRMSKLPLASLLEMIAPLHLHAVGSGIVMLIGGLGLILGLKTRISSILLIMMLIPITITVQLQGGDALGPLFKNIAILGGLIYFAYFGAKGWSMDNCKAKFFSFLAFLVLGYTSPVQAETVDKLVVLVKKEQHLKVTIKTMLEGKKDVDDLKIKQGTIIVCGKEASPLLLKESSLTQELTLAKGNGIDLVACEISLKQANIEPKALIPFIRIVPNGLRELIRLKAQGYMGIDL